MENLEKLAVVIAVALVIGLTAAPFVAQAMHAVDQLVAPLPNAEEVAPKLKALIILAIILFFIGFLLKELQ